MNLRGLIFAGLLFAGVWISAQSNRIDLNTADYEELHQLPLSAAQLEALYQYLLYQGPLNSFYDLRNVPGFDEPTLTKLKPLVIVTPPSAVTAYRLGMQALRLEYWTGAEGTNESLIEFWLDQLLEPLNVNAAEYEDLVALQNVSPVDAAAVIRLRKQIGGIYYQRALRNAVGLSYYGYRNLRDLVSYEPGASRLHVRYNFTLKTVPSTISTDEEVQYPPVENIYRPDLQHKLVLSWPGKLSLGLAYQRQLGERDRLVEIGGHSWPALKTTLTIERRRWGPLFLKRLVLGNYAVTMGQGVVFQNTDFRAPRWSGYGWSKRAPGLYPDLSRTIEYALRGTAAEMQLGSHLRFLGFWSLADRDAVVNPDTTSFTALITLYPRRDEGLRDSLFYPMKNAVKEMTYGGEVKWIFGPGIYLGLSSYESLYDKVLEPRPATIIAPQYQGLFLTSYGNGADPEIAAMYHSRGESPLWSAARSFRRVHGVEFSWVGRRLAVQGEWGVLDRGVPLSELKSQPQAWVVNAYWQSDKLNLLVLYRHYDLAYDNPYQRSFSNYQRYKGSIFEDEFYLRDPVLAYLYTGASQPQAEKGLYVRTRYQVSRAWIWTVDYDTWTRVADGARYFRTVSRLEYRPWYNVRLYWRQKWQARAPFNLLSPTRYYNRESILTARVRLARYDDLQLTWFHSFTQFAPRRRLVVDLTTGAYNSSLVGNAGSPAQALSFRLRHHFSPNFQAVTGITAYQGFYWTFEETDFRVLNSPVPSLRWYVSFGLRPTDHWYVRLKAAREEGGSRTNFAYGEQRGDPRALQPDVYNYQIGTDYRLQVDYVF